MNQLLYARATGNLGPQAFARIQTSQRVNAIQPFPRLRFDGGGKEVVGEEKADGSEVEDSKSIWAHQAGVNALALDVDGKM